MSTSSGSEAVGFDARLRLFSSLFFAVGISMALVIFNTTLIRDDNPEGMDSAAVNAIAAAGATVALTVPFIPWHRCPRDAYFVVPVAATLLIALCTYFSGGWDSFAYRLYVLVALLYGLYFPARLVVSAWDVRDTTGGSEPTAL